MWSAMALAMNWPNIWKNREDCYSIVATTNLASMLNAQDQLWLRGIIAY